jgi:hypothetical protein
MIKQQTFNKSLCILVWLGRQAVLWLCQVNWSVLYWLITVWARTLAGATHPSGFFLKKFYSHFLVLFGCRIKFECFYELSFLYNQTNALFIRFLYYFLLKSLRWIYSILECQIRRNRVHHNPWDCIKSGR